MTFKHTLSRSNRTHFTFPPKPIDPIGLTSRPELPMLHPSWPGPNSWLAPGSKRSGDDRWQDDHKPPNPFHAPRHRGLTTFELIAFLAIVAAGETALLGLAVYIFVHFGWRLAL